MQTGLTVGDDDITGTLNELTTGQLVTDWGAGYFMALNFANIDADAQYVEVGLVPSVSSGFVKLDSDHDAVMKVTDKDTQKLVVRQVDGLFITEQVFDLSGLTLN